MAARVHREQATKQVKVIDWNEKAAIMKPNEKYSKAESVPESNRLLLDIRAS